MNGDQLNQSDEITQMPDNKAGKNIIKPFKRNGLIGNIIIWILIVFSIFAFLIYPIIPKGNVKEVTIKELVKEIKDNDANVKIKVKDDNSVEVELPNGDKRVAFYIGSLNDFVELLEKNEVDIKNIKDYDNEKTFQIGLDTIFFVVIAGGAIFATYMLIKSINASGSKMTSFSQTTAKLFLGQKTNTKFEDVAGIDEAKEELKEVVDFLKHPKKYFELGARIPRGILLIGPPGAGKTLLARAVAGEANVPFFYTSGAEFEEMLVGAGAARVRDLFKKAKRLSPCIVFIDEIDAVAKKREVSLRSSYTEQTLNQILVEMDGFSREDAIIILAATNRPDILDPAILRPGRFDRKVVVDRPDMKGRESILKVHCKNKPLAEEVNLEIIAKKTVGLSGADIENIANEAAIIAAKEGRKKIEMKDFEESVLKVMYGPKRISKKQKEEELLNTAYHESGHAIVAYFTPNTDPVHKISIVSRGISAGMTMQLPEEDKNNLTKDELLSRIRIYVSGQIAEKLMTNTFTTGASNDIEQATKLATKMVKEFGMSKNLGFVKYGESVNEYWLGYSFEENSNYSEKFAAMIDEEIQNIINKEYKEAEKILTKNKNKLEGLAKLLMSKEVISREEFEGFMKDDK